MSTPKAIDYADAPRAAVRDPALSKDPLIGSAELPTLIGRAVTVNCTPREAYDRWRDLSQAHRFMVGVQQVTVLDEHRVRIIVGDEEGKKGEWELTVIEDVAPRLIAWRAVEDEETVHEGKVGFTPATGGRGTVVTATLALKGSRGRISEWWGRVFHHDPKIQADRQLRRFKQWVETGETSTSKPPAAAPRAS